MNAHVPASQLKQIKKPTIDLKAIRPRLDPENSFDARLARNTCTRSANVGKQKSGPLSVG